VIHDQYFHFQIKTGKIRRSRLKEDKFKIVAIAKIGEKGIDIYKLSDDRQLASKSWHP